LLEMEREIRPTGRRRKDIYIYIYPLYRGSMSGMFHLVLDQILSHFDVYSSLVNLTRGRSRREDLRCGKISRDIQLDWHGEREWYCAWKNPEVWMC
jgi:hypothetical protein